MTTNNELFAYNLILDSDSYKVDHVNEYPEDTTYIYSSIIARKPNKFSDRVVVMGHQYAIQKYLSTRITMEMIDGAESEIVNSGYDFRRDLWEIIVKEYDGKLPLEIRAVPEGTIVPVGAVILTVVNTDPRFFWLTSYVETLLQRIMWKIKSAYQAKSWSSNEGGGYIWHTTGSGKTVTSFKVAQLLAAAPRIKNVLFIVDRVDLIDQTLENFKDFAYTHFKNRIKKVNGRELKRELKHKGASQILLISVQGLTKAVKKGLVNNDWNVFK